MSYLVLARKSRPQTFDEVVGQNPVVRTLQNALRQGRVAHALVFSGVRGTGKTTLARIMAKALNCEQGPTPTPCNQCRSCREIMAGSSVDLHEVDGASNRGIQEIRELKDNIRFMPTAARYKIIIIDEVHMLTTEAFNALLKTLEEPPDHVYFMFATTELHKVPVTILSRCQRHELKRIPLPLLVDHFANLARQEGVEVEPGALRIIAREAGGSVRDGLSLLDQVFSYGGERVTSQDVTDVLGLVSQEVILEVADALLEGDLARALACFDRTYEYGMDLKRFANELLDCFRSMLICRACRNPEQILDLPAEELETLREKAASRSVETLAFMLRQLLTGLESAAFSSRPRFAVEMAFIQAVQVNSVVPVADLLVRFDQVLAGLPIEEDSGARLQPVPAGPPPVRSSPPTTEAGGPSPVPPPGTGDEDAGEEAAEEKPERQGTDDTGPARAAEEERGADTEPVVAGAVRPGREVRKHWNEFIAYVRDRKVWMAQTLQLAASAEMEDGKLVIRFADSTDCRLLTSRENSRQLTEFALDFFQGDFEVVFQAPDVDGCASEGDNGVSPQQERQALARDPLVLTALEIFNGQVGDIRVGPRFRQPLAEQPGKTGNEHEHQ